MSSNDISQLLKDWPYEPGRIIVRRIEGADGRPRAQLRLPLGVLQVDLDDRPDGERPHGFESLLEYHLDRIARYSRDTGVAEAFVLSPEECSALREEAVMYYHRYVACFVLEDYDRVVRDTTRNLKVLDLCRDHAADEEDRYALEQFRSYILMMRARGAASRAINQGEPKLALAALDHGIAEIEQALIDVGLGEGVEESSEIQLLHAMRDALVPKLPTSQRVELEERLKAALAAENYELASILRDELRMLRQ